jgi:drug/metabolite transporter (DMT)-like permease
MRQSSWIRLVVLGAIWGSSFIFMRVAVPAFGPFTSAFGRLFIGGLALALVLPALKQRLEFRRHFKQFLGFGLINSAIPFSLYAFAALKVPAAYSAVLNSTSPLWGTVFAFLIVREAVSWRQWLGVVIGIVGVALLVKPAPGVVFDLGIFLGLGAGLAAAACYGLAGVLIKKSQHKIPSTTLAAGTQLGAALFILPFALIQMPSTLPPASPTWSLLILGILCSGVAYLLYFKLVKDEGATSALLVTLLIPIFAMLWGYLFLQESITLRMLIGCALIFIGMRLSTYARSPKKIS